MSNRLATFETHLAVLCRCTTSCARQEAQSSQAQPFMFSAIDRKLLHAITSQSTHSTLQSRRFSCYQRSNAESSRLQPWAAKRFYNKAPKSPSLCASISTDTKSNETEAHGHVQHNISNATRDFESLQLPQANPQQRDAVQGEKDMGIFSAALVDIYEEESTHQSTPNLPRWQGSTGRLRRVAKPTTQGQGTDIKFKVFEPKHKHSFLSRTRAKDIQKLADADETIPAATYQGHKRVKKLMTEIHKWFRGNEKVSVPSQRSAPPSGFNREFALMLFKHPELHAIQNKWQRLSDTAKRSQWRNVVFTCLTSSTSQTLTFLKATHLDLPSVPRTFISSLSCLRWWQWQEVNADPDRRKTFDELAQWAIGKTVEQGFHPPWRSIALSLEYSTAAQGREIFDRLLKKSEHVISSKMGLRFMNFFTEAKDVEYALKAFHEAAKFTEALDSEFMLRSCSKLLMLDFVERTEHSQNFRILPELLEAGIEPNLIIHNIVLANSFKGELSNVMWDVFRYMQQQQLPTDSYTYLVLLKDTLRTSNVEELSQVLAAIDEREDLANNIYLIGHTLHAIHVLHHGGAKVQASSAFEQMLPYYKKRLQLAPLQNLLRLPDVLGNIDFAADEQKIKPTIPILEMMTWSYIGTAATSTVVIRLWRHFKDLISSGDGLVSSLMEADYIINAFLFFFARSPATLRYLMDVMDFMIHSDKPPLHNKPTARSYTIAVLGMLRHERRSEAKALLRTMIEDGVRPGVEVWDQILGPYLLHKEEAIIMMQRVEREALGLWKENESTLDLESWAEAAAFGDDSEGLYEEDEEEEYEEEEKDEIRISSSAGG